MKAASVLADPDANYCDVGCLHTQTYGALGLNMHGLGTRLPHALSERRHLFVLAGIKQMRLGNSKRRDIVMTGRALEVL